jgi:homocysteine S-methyltransferase
VTPRSALSLAGTYVTDGGMETTLIFQEGVDLPHFASFPLVESDEGRETLHAYFAPYVAIAREQGVGLQLDTPTWRANRDWGARLGYSPDDLDRINRRAAELMEDLRSGEPDVTIVVAGAVGPRGDGYRADERMTAAAAERYHSAQVGTFAETTVDLVGALTLTYPEEAIGIVRAARAAEMPAAISFTVETDGRLPSGVSLREAIERVDAETDGAAAFFMVNCAHPSHFEGALDHGAAWTDRIGGVRANASRLSHAELDEADELDEGDPADLAEHYRGLRPVLRRANVVGGCCGTDHRHVAEICRAWVSSRP